MYHETIRINMKLMKVAMFPNSKVNVLVHVDINTKSHTFVHKFVL